MATLRQKGAPTLFMTFSCAEFEWDHLIQSIYKTVYKKDITIEEVQNLPNSFRSKLVGENVVQSTIHFSKRTSKLMSLMKEGGFFLSMMVLNLKLTVISIVSNFKQEELHTFIA